MDYFAELAKIERERKLVENSLCSAEVKAKLQLQLALRVQELEKAVQAGAAADVPPGKSPKGG